MSRIGEKSQLVMVEVQWREKVRTSLIGKSSRPGLEELRRIHQLSHC